MLGCMDVRALLGHFTRVWVSRRETCRFPWVDGWSTDTPGLGRHTYIYIYIYIEVTSFNLKKLIIFYYILKKLNEMRSFNFFFL